MFFGRPSSTYRTQFVNMSMPPCFMDGVDIKPDDVKTLTSDVFDSNASGNIGFLSEAEADVNIVELGAHRSFQDDRIPLDSPTGIPSVERTISMMVANFRFEEGLVPCEAPTDSFFKFETTTLFIPLGQLKPHELGNAIIELLDADMLSEITQVNNYKFTIRASASACGAKCEVKIRIHRHLTSYAIEFQRCSGDSFVFADWYHFASEGLISLLTYGVQEQVIPATVGMVVPRPAPFSSTNDKQATSSCSHPLTGDDECQRTLPTVEGNHCLRGLRVGPASCQSVLRVSQGIGAGGNRHHFKAATSMLPSRQLEFHSC